MFPISPVITWGHIIPWDRGNKTPWTSKQRIIKTSASCSNRAPCSGGSGPGVGTWRRPAKTRWRVWIRTQSTEQVQRFIGAVVKALTLRGVQDSPAGRAWISARRTGRDFRGSAGKGRGELEERSFTLQAAKSNPLARMTFILLAIKLMETMVRYYYILYLRSSLVYMLIKEILINQILNYSDR